MHPQERPSTTPATGRRARSPGGIAVALSLTVLAATFYVPVAAARRTARVEERGDRLAELLLEVARPFGALRLADDQVREIVFARLLLLADCRGVYVGDLQLLADRLPGDGGPEAITLRNKHYFVQVRRSPPLDDRGLPSATDDPASLPIEVIAWPALEIGPAHAVFFYPSIAEPAFTRNLVAGYVAEKSTKWPPPGAPYRRPLERHPWSYRAIDDERWILRDRPEFLSHARSR